MNVIALSPAEERALQRLGYDRLWIDRGVLRRASLLEQVRELESEDGDPNPEHHRGAILVAFLDGKSALSDDDVATLLQLAALDPDQTFRSSFAHGLIRFRGLTGGQFELVASQAVDRAFERVVARARLLRALDAAAPTAISDALASRDGAVHIALLERRDLSIDHLQQLAKDGANKAIRNRALQLLDRRRP